MFYEVGYFSRRRRGHIVVFCNILYASAGFQLFKHLHEDAVGKPVIFGQERDILIKSLAAGGADISSFADM